MVTGLRNAKRHLVQVQGRNFLKTRYIMRELKKIRMQDITPLQDPEMKAVRGGYYGGSGSGYYGGGSGSNGGSGSGGSGTCTWSCTTDAQASISRWGYCSSSDDCWAQAEASCSSDEGIRIDGC